MFIFFFMSYNYTYEELIDRYFHDIDNKLSKFKAEKCQQFVQQYKKNFNEEKFRNSLAYKLLLLDDELSDYDTSDEEAENNSN